MNLVGKIFTVLIFVMSLVFMAFTVMVYATHVNWQRSPTIRRTRRPWSTRWACRSSWTWKSNQSRRWMTENERRSIRT